MRHVITIADEATLRPFSSAEMFRSVCASPAPGPRVVEVTQGVDDRTDDPCTSPDGGLFEDAGDDAIHPAVQIGARLLKRSRAPIGPSTKSASPPNCLIASSNSAGTQRWLFKQQGDGLVTSARA